MTEKEQIIIDGVDVSKCKYLPYCNDKQGNCAFVPNCYFKQLARKTQECEELKRKVELMMDCPDCKVDEYKKALEEIETATKINCEEICGRKFADCNDTSCLSAEVLDIINKTKDTTNET